MSDIRYKWARGATSVGVSHDVSLPQFKVLGYRQKDFEISLLTGNYSRLACEIQFVRSMGYYLIQIYIPSSLIVIMSWVSFWLNRNASPARVPLGITTVLTMTTLMSSTNKELPKISYVKSIDIFLGTCFVMVFAALLEYATVGYLAKRIQMRKNHFAALQKMALELQKQREEERRQQEEADEAIRLFHMQQQRHTPHYHTQGRSMSSMSCAPNSPYPLKGGGGGPDSNTQTLPYSHSTRRYNNEDMGHSHYGDGGGGGGGRGYHGGNKLAPRERVLKEEDAILLENTLRKIRIQVNSNQICGIAPSDIDK